MLKTLQNTKLKKHFKGYLVTFLKTAAFSTAIIKKLIFGLTLGKKIKVSGPS